MILQCMRNLSIENGPVLTMYYFHIIPFLSQQTGMGISYFWYSAWLWRLQPTVSSFAGKRCEALAFHLVGTTKVLSYEDIAEAQRKRDSKDAAREGRAK